MNLNKYFPVIYALISALISFIAACFICLRTFHLSLPASVGIGAIFAIFFYGLSYFRGHASQEIKRIAFKYQLSDEQLAQITGMKATDFPIYHDRLQLIIPKRKWPLVLDALQKYEKSHPISDKN
ncbi:hypothetical protein J2Z60_001307 [Lactobacillus colini]|uniref:ABC transporter ATP-binding protein n=1 Tax=Lactobacillus colini TaxID=1819254 RepID=A0ABS4MEM3_9LACO|nr:hypothetical protein [Lactobacillus colini]MBP2058130.1 hypothetical protein [Lactobacillus colini]